MLRGINQLSGHYFLPMTNAIQVPLGQWFAIPNSTGGGVTMF